MRKKVFTCLVLFWMIVIFAFSARNADTSSKDSSRIGMLVGKIFIKDFQEWDFQKKDSFAKKIDHPVRKTAHATEYAVLGILLFGALYQPGRQKKREAFFSWGIGTFYAATDEIHQLFVPGRSGQVTDVLLDSCGAAAGVLFCLLINYFLKSAKRN
ncbi:VanZ family protein [bacterium D16-51]|nr:VanZ family protein [bacterium D16-59]RKI54540.1 VanZ family protein [bacterium D16-51]